MIPYHYENARSQVNSNRPFPHYTLARLLGEVHVEIGVDATATAAGGPGMEEGFGWLCGEFSCEGEVEEERCVFIGRVFGAEDEYAH